MYMHMQLPTLSVSNPYFRTDIQSLTGILMAIMRNPHKAAVSISRFLP